MFDRLLDLVVKAWDRLAPAEIVNAYEAGVVLRFGRYARTVGPGLAWKIPFVDNIITAKTCVTTMRLPAQSLTTADYKHMVVAAIVKYQIRDVRPFMLDVWDATDVLADVTMGAIKTVVNRSDHESLIGEDAERSVLELVRKEVNRYGFQILRVTFTDVAAVKSLRLLGGTPVQNVDN